MYKVGLTGGIGSGKTTVCQIFTHLGIPVFNSDLTARYLLDNDEEVRNQIIEWFGKELYDKKHLDRKKLASIIFNNKDALERVNQLVHPLVRFELEKWLEKHSNLTYVIQEAAILFESGAYKQMDKIITVTAPLELRIKRIMERDGSTHKQVAERIKNQIPEQEKVKRSDFVIINDENNLVIPQILKIHKTLTKE